MSIDRRRFLRTAGIALGVGMAPKVASAAKSKGGRGGSKRRSVGGTAGAGQPLFDGLELGSWTILDVVPHLGAIAVLLDSEAGPFQLDVVKKDDRGPEGVANTRSLAIFVLNRGRGRLATSEDQGLAARALAVELDAREAAGAEVPALLTLTERIKQHPRGIFEIKQSQRRRSALG